MGTFVMPSLGADMDRGTVVEWRVAPGDEVHRGDIVAVVDTEKSTIEVEVFETGVIADLLVEPGVEVEVGTPLATIEASGTDARPGSTTTAPPVDARGHGTDTVPATPAGAPAPARPSPETTATRRATPPPVPVSSGEAPAHHHPAHPHAVSPLVRSLAERLGVDLDTVAGTGPAGTVTRHDLEAAVRRDVRLAARTRARPGRPPLRGAPSARPPTHEPGWVPASPLARRLAAQRRLDLRALVGSGPDGAVRARDLPAAAAVTATAVRAPTEDHGRAHPGPPAAPDAVVPAAVAPSGDPRRDAVATLMARAKRDIPHYYLRTDIDLSRVVAAVEEANADRPPAQRLVPTAFLLWATARAAAREPRLNGHWVDGRLVSAEDVQLGVAISLRDGTLLAPVIPGADRLTVDELMAQLRDLTARARSGGLRASEMTDPTLTVTNLGDRGVEEVLGVIYPPQVAMLGFGRVARRPWVVDGSVTACPVVTATLSGDHRASNGHEGARLLTAIDRLLQRPEDAWTEPPPAP